MARWDALPIAIGNQESGTIRYAQAYLFRQNDRDRLSGGVLRPLIGVRSMPRLDSGAVAPDGMPSRTFRSLIGREHVGRRRIFGGIEPSLVGNVLDLLVAALF